MFVESLVIHHDHFPRKDRYPFALKVFRETEGLRFRGKVTFFVGENGTGKSTLLEAIARRFGLTVWGGERTHIVHENPFETRLYNFISLSGSWDGGGIKKGFLFRAENFFNFASYLDDLTQSDPSILRYYGGRSFHQQSHGQAFFSFFKSRCRIPGLYLLDEPEAALSPSNQLAMVKKLWELTEKRRVQFIISTHSPIILSYPEAQILSFDFIPIKEIIYEQTRSYRFYKRFMNEKSYYIGQLRGSARDKEEENDGEGELSI